VGAFRARSERSWYTLLFLKRDVSYIFIVSVKQTDYFSFPIHSKIPVRSNLSQHGSRRTSDDVQDCEAGGQAEGIRGLYANWRT